MPARRTVSDLESHLGYWLRIVSNGVSHAFARKLDALDITVAEWVFMRKLFDADALSPTRLADQMGMTKGAISKLADRLIAKGLVARTADPDDRRAHTLALTGPGRNKVPRLAALADANDEEFFGLLSKGDRATFERTLKVLVERRGLKTVPTE